MNTPRRHTFTSDDELQLAAMRLVAESPSASQRSLARALGISLGKTNFLLRALLEKGLVKAENFRRSDNKLAYLYLLTPNGVVTKAKMTQAYLQRKEGEYARLQEEIARLRTELARGDSQRRDPGIPTTRPASKQAGTPTSNID